MKCVIIDDDSRCIKTLSEIIKKYCPQLQIQGSVSTISEAVDLINQTLPDLIFLDIEMKNETGFDLFKYFPSPSFKVVFTTAHEKYALKAIKSSCFDFLLKPVIIEEVIQVVKKLELEKKESTEKNVHVLLENLGSKDGQIKKLAIPCADGLSFWHINDIVCLEANGKYTRIVAKDMTSSLSSKNLGEFEEMLDAEIFFRTHKSWIVNLTYVKKFLKSESQVLLVNDLIADVSSRKKDEFLKLFSKA